MSAVEDVGVVDSCALDAKRDLRQCQIDYLRSLTD